MTDPPTNPLPDDAAPEHDDPASVNAPAQPIDDPFAPQPTLALDHVPPINVEVGTGAHGEPAKLPPRPLEMGGLRIIIIGWCFWLLGSWGVAWFSDTAVPRARWMLLAGLLGMMLAYPAVRLSQSPNPDEPGRGAMQVLFDWLCLISVFQAVLWSLHLIAAWPLSRGLWLDAAVVSWTLLAALIVGWARLYASSVIRTLGMALCIALVVAEPLVLWLTGTRPGSEGWLLRVSPLQAVWELSSPPMRTIVHDWPPQILLIGLVAVSGWASLIGWRVLDALIARKLRPEPEVVDLAAQPPD